MKNVLIIVFTLFTDLQLIAQEGEPYCIRFSDSIEYNEDNQVYTLVYNQAQPKEGFERFYKMVNRKFNSKDILPYKDEYHITLRFVVERDGTFSDIEIFQDNDGIGEEAIRVLKTMPKWNPAQHNGEVVRSRFTLPIKIRTDKKPPVTETKSSMNQRMNQLTHSLIN